MEEKINKKIKQIVIKVIIDKDKDEFGNKISVYGYDDDKKILNDVELIGILDLIHSQEILRFFKREK